MPKFKKINFLFSTLMIVLSLFTGCNKTNSTESNAYHDPTYNPFGKYEETVKIKGVME